MKAATKNVGLMQIESFSSFTDSGIKQELKSRHSYTNLCW